MKRVMIVLVALASVTSSLLAAGEEESDGARSSFVYTSESGPGILIGSILEDSPAERAGLIRGDILLAVDGNEVDTVSDLRALLYDYEAGTDVTLTISRGGEEREIGATLETRLYRPALGIEGGRAEFGPAMRGEVPGRFGGRGDHERFEFRFDDGRRPGSDGLLRFRFGPQILEYYGDDAPHGDIVTGLADGGPAANAGVQRFDIVTAVDGVDLTGETLADIVAQSSPGDLLELSVLRLVDGEGEELSEPEVVTIAVELGENDDGDALLGVSFFALRSRMPDESRVLNGGSRPLRDGAGTMNL